MGTPSITEIIFISYILSHYFKYFGIRFYVSAFSTKNVATMGKERITSKGKEKLRVNINISYNYSNIAGPGGTCDLVKEYTN